MKHVKVISLDLDDTLWDLAPVIARAEGALQEWFRQHYPRVTERFSLEDMRAMRRAVEVDFPGREYDLPLLRRAALARLALESGSPDDLVEAAFAAFQRVRNQVTLDDVRPALERLARHATVVALTNGTADLEAIGLRHYFAAVFTARDVGAAKPDPRAFQVMCARLQLDPSQVLHAGDHPYHDVEGARAQGMHAVWVDRGLHAWPDELAPAAHVVGDLGKLAGLLGA